jgi:hypothetical protein
MPHVIAPHTPVLMRRLSIPIASYFSHDVGSENIPIQCQLPEISEVFLKGAAFDNNGPSSPRLRDSA